MKADDIHLRHAVDHILRRFPSVSEVTSRDTFRSVSIPRQLTEQYLVDLNQRMIKAARMRDRKLAYVTSFQLPEIMILLLNYHILACGII